jgi:alpha amylase-like protein
VGKTRPQHPALYQINTRAWMHELGIALGRPATLADIPDAELDLIAARGFDWVWPLGVWQTGEAGRQVSLHEPSWQREYRELLADVNDADVCGSPFAVREYAVSRDFGGPRALARLRERLAGRGVGLILDFVPNHTALDHPWVRTHPEFYVQGTSEDHAREPGNFARVESRDGTRVLAHGRDPYFPGWPDTLQLNYRHAGLRAAMLDVLQSVAEQCDGVRCDMAMLVLPDIVLRTWGERAQPADGGSPVDTSFWSEAISAVRARQPEFVFLAEAYWDLEWRLQQEGFDYTYDKRLYDRLREQDAADVVGHLGADAGYQRRSMRFLENHDEPRAAATFPPEVHPAAAVLGLLLPGLRLLHDGQVTGRRLRTSNHLRRRAPEPVDRELEGLYHRLLACMQRPEVRDGQWQLLRAHPPWEGNQTCQQVIAYRWQSAEHLLVVAVNYGPQRAQCYLPLGDLPPGGSVRLHDLMHARVTYERSAADLARPGLYLDVPSWRAHVFEVEPAP